MSERWLLLWLRIAFVVFLLQGVQWVILGRFDPFGLWDGLATEHFFPDRSGENMPADAAVFKQFVLGPFGATNAGFWLLALCLLEIPVRRGERWAYRALVAGILCWFTIDTTASLAHGAVFNVLMVNLPCLAIAGTPLLWLGIRRRRAP